MYLACLLLVITYLTLDFFKVSKYFKELKKDISEFDALLRSFMSFIFIFYLLIFF